MIIKISNLSLVAAFIRVWLVSALIFLSSCINYDIRYEILEAQRRVGNSGIDKNLDSKLGPRGKVFLHNDDNAKWYLSGDGRNKVAYTGAGFMYYFSPYASIETGFQVPIKSYRKYDRRTSVDIEHIYPIDDDPFIFVVGILRF